MKTKFFTDDKIFDIVNRALICLFAFMVAYPLLYVLFASVSSGFAVDTGQVTFFPVDFTLAAYYETWANPVFWRSYANSIFLTASGTLFSMLVALTGGYALSKKNLPGHRLFNFMMLFTMWFSAGMIPIYLNLQSLNLLNWTGLIVGFGVAPFAIVIVRSAFASIPKEMEEAGLIDGANEFQNFFYIALPCIKPAMVTVSLMYGIMRWNGFFWAMIVVTEERLMPLQVYLRRLIILRETQWETAEFFALGEHSHQTIIYSVIIMSIIPILLLFPFIQKVFKRGVMEGGLKG